MLKQISFAIVLMASATVYGQKEVIGYSSKKPISITKEIKPPLLAIKNLKFSDSDGNNFIDAFEACSIQFDISNSGYGDGYGLKAKLNTAATVNGIVFTKETPIEVLKVGETRSIKLPINATMNTLDGNASFSLQVEEPNGFGTSVYELEVKTLAFVSPLVKVTSHTVTSALSGTLEKKQPFDLQVLVQNIKHGTAEDVNISLQLPTGVLLVGGQANLHYPKLTAGETKDLTYTLIVGDNLQGNNVSIKVNISEKYGKYAESETLNLVLNQAMAQNKIVVDGKAQQYGEIQIASLKSDVDDNIPVSAGKKANTYALIFGNEDYKKYQPDLSTESNVKYARNDALVFRDYCVKTLGIPAENITLQTDAISSVMKREIERFIDKAQYGNGQAELIFYYSGHGFPHDKNKDGISDESFIMPVDISSTTVTEGIALSDLYAKLTQHTTQRVTVFMDACFSGGGREAGLLSAKATKYKQKEIPVKGNLVVFAASSESQESLFYNEKQHGLFTYYLLKKLQQTNGDISYQELHDYLKNEVPKTASDKYYKQQNPQAIYSPEAQNLWGAWRFK